MSEAAIAANRSNAKKCTGPKTREGKFKTSLNAFKHGLYSKNFIIKTEDAAVFEDFSKSFIDEFQPSTPSELELLQQLISVAWRRHRVAELIQLRIDKAIDATLAAANARQEAHELRLATLFQRTLSRLQSIRDKKLRNETIFARDGLSFAA